MDNMGGGLIPNKQQVEEAIAADQRRSFIRQKKAETLDQITPNSIDSQWEYLKGQSKTWADEDFGLDGRMERIVPRSFTTEGLNQQDFTETVIERGSIDSSKFGSISTEKILDAITDAVQITGTLAGSTTLNNGQQAVITVTIEDSADPNRVILGVCHITPYEDSVAGAQVIPYGSNVSETNWHYLNRADWNSNNNKKSTWIDFVSNVAAGASTPVLWRAHYRYIGRITQDA